MALDTSAEQPVPVRTVARLIGEWVDRLGRVWVEGQVAQLNRRPGASTVFLTLRDPVADVSVTVTCSARVLDAVVPPLVDGARVVVHAKPGFYLTRGTLSLVATEIRAVGLGALLARLEQLRTTLAAEGLFAADRKQPLPFLPRRRRAGLRPRLGRRARRARERAPPLARGRVPRGERRGAGRLRRHRGDGRAPARSTGTPRSTSSS